MMLIFFREDKARYRVLGIGVAESDKISKEARIFFNFSFCLTPNLCSSSMANSPRFLNSTSFDKTRWVPITMSICPCFSFWMISFCSFLVCSRLSSSNLIGRLSNLFLKVWKCWEAKIVVGQIRAAWKPELTALTIILKATSVLPKPTSPQTILSKGIWEVSRSFLMSSIAWIWSGVSS